MVECSGELIIVVMILVNGVGFRVEYWLSWCVGGMVCEVMMIFINGLVVLVMLEMLSSFLFGGFILFVVDDVFGWLWVYWFCLGWSVEGWFEMWMLEEFYLECLWSGVGVFSECFG